MAVSRLVGRGLSLHERLGHSSGSFASPTRRPACERVPVSRTRVLGSGAFHQVEYPKSLSELRTPWGCLHSADVPAKARFFGAHALPRLPAGCGALGPTRFACRGSLTPRCDASRAATLTRIVDWAFFAPARFGWPNPRGHRRADRGVNSARPVKVTQPTPMSLAADSRRART